MSEYFHFKVLTRPDELEEVVRIQQTVWGRDTVTPQSHLTAAVHHGGVVIAALAGEKYIGFCYGFAGFHGQETYLVSHMAAFLPDYRDLGLGRQLKQRQRLWALENGYAKMVWTFDPLQTRNAYLNLCKLGGIVRTYIPDMYGEIDDEINKGQATDRFLLEWEMSSNRVVEALRGISPEQEYWQSYPQAFSYDIDGKRLKPGPDHDISTALGVRVPVPNTAWHDGAMEADLLPAWRLTVRRHLMALLAENYTVVGLIRTQGPVHFYVLEGECSQ